MFRYRPEYDQAKEQLHKIKEVGEIEPYWTKAGVFANLARSGHVEWCVLKTVGPNLLSSKGKKRLAELERKFSAEQVPTSTRYEARRVWFTDPIGCDPPR